MIGDWVDDHLGWILASFLGAVSLGLIVLGYLAIQDYSRLKQQCLDDGKKEYECVSMLHSNTPTVVPMPIIIGR